MKKSFTKFQRGAFFLFCAACLTATWSCDPDSNNQSSDASAQSVHEVMDGVVSRLYADITKTELDALDEAAILALLTASEKEVLSTKYWEFTVDQPVRVSLMRDSKQASNPFWLEGAGFVKTELRVQNSIAVYEVWQKDFPAGKVSLGINGFDRHRPVYFVSVAPLESGQDLLLSPIFPEEQHVDVLRPGAFTYHDWDGLLLDSVPDALLGEALLTTIRGRAREAHLIGAFRETEHPSSEHPDQVVLTYQDDPSNSMTIQWRCTSSVEKGEVLYWIENSSDTLRQEADRELLEDRLLYNDRYISRFTASLEGLQPGQTYAYTVQGAQGVRSEPALFHTASAPIGQSSEEGFEFIWGGDTHNDPSWTAVMQRIAKHHPDAAFYLHSGDIVNTGLHRDDWDQYFQYSDNAFSHMPMMAIPGNHDSQDGLGAWMFQSLLRYPPNGPAGYSPGLTYSFRYENALFLMMDAASIPVADQTDWIEEQLSSAPEATWKFLMVHFPPFNEVEPYPEITEYWSPLLEKYGVDMVMSGHFHYYMRTEPLIKGIPHPDGVSYLMSVATNASREARDKQSFVARRHELRGNLYQRFQIKENTLIFTAYDKDGNELDRLSIKK